MLSMFVVAYAAVFAAELAGDKLLYTTGVLAARYRPAAILAGVTCAVAVKMAAAVLVGALIAQIPRLVVAAMTAASFAALAIMVFRKADPVSAVVEDPRPLRGALTAFACVLGSEWGDLGQITAATLAARFQSPAAVWLGAVAAMSTKCVLGAWLGVGARLWLRQRLPPRFIRYGSAVLLLLLGGLSVAGSLVGRR